MEDRRFSDISWRARFARKTSLRSAYFLTIPDAVASLAIVSNLTKPNLTPNLT